MMNGLVNRVCMHTGKVRELTFARVTEFSCEIIDHTQGHRRMDPDSPWEENPHNDHVPEAEWTKIASEFTNVGCSHFSLHPCSFLIIVWVPRGHHCRKRSVFTSRFRCGFRQRRRTSRSRDWQPPWGSSCNWVSVELPEPRLSGARRTS